VQHYYLTVNTEWCIINTERKREVTKMLYLFDLQNDYDDYCWECEQEGTTPIDFDTWVKNWWEEE
jgi:hypothetical protein